MTNYPYNNNVPNPPDDPGDDVGDMNQNAQSISGIISTDHVGFNIGNSEPTGPQGGYHNLIHQPNQTVGGQTVWDPANSGIIAAIQAAKIAGVQQTFPLLYTPNTTGGAQDTQLYTMTGGGGISQLTGNLASSDGWCWVGGALLQWGSFVKSAGHWPGVVSTITFKDRIAGAIPFPNACFIVLTTFMGPTSGSSAEICIDSKSAANFTWEVAGNSSDPSYNGFYWFAIGN